MRERLNRWGFRALVVALLAVGGYYATFGGVYSAFDIRQMEGDRSVLQDSVYRLETVTDSLVQRGDSLLSDPSAIERVAREQGYLRDGELRVRFIPTTEEDDGDAAGARGTTADPETPPKRP
jgi:cell division protein FtsB